MLSNKEAIGQFTTPQKTEISPIAAPKLGCSPSRLPVTFPKVAPIKKDGTISPPLKPAAKVIEVKIILKRKAVGWIVFPPKAWLQYPFLHRYNHVFA